MYITLKNKQTNLTKRLNDALAVQQIVNVFNPSICLYGDKIYITFRGSQASGKKPFDAYLLIIVNDTENQQLINLTEILSKYAAPVADPKLLILEDNIWVTFNTGWSKDFNEIYLSQITPCIQPPKRCVYHNRQQIEKNWSFFMRGDKLLALYMLENAQFLSADLHQYSDKIVFSDCSILSSRLPDLKHYSQGTQVLNYQHQYYLVAHRKFYRKEKALYIGRMVKFSLEGKRVEFALSRKYIFHSLKSLMGAKKKHNDNLISCSYFSGLSMRDDEILLAYGVNDVDFCFSEISYKRLW